MHVIWTGDPCARVLNMNFAREMVIAQNLTWEDRIKSSLELYVSAISKGQDLKNTIYYYYYYNVPLVGRDQSS